MTKLLPKSKAEIEGYRLELKDATSCEDKNVLRVLITSRSDNLFNQTVRLEDCFCYDTKI